VRPLGILAAALVLVGAASAAPRDLVERGRQLYERGCSSCHGPGGQGNVALGPARGSLGLAGRGPSLVGVGAQAADFYLRTGYMPLRKADRQPRRHRPAYGEHQIQALVAYVASLTPGPPVPRPHPERGDLSVGYRLFREKCAGCHQIVGAGGIVTGAVAPPLGKATPTQVAEAVRIGPYLMPRFSRRDISDRELDSIVRYVQETKHPDDRGGWALGRVGPVTEGIVAWLLAGGALVGVAVVIGGRAR
jgi:ubiquinol-cytochrome c reductase cytochrome c subunit